VDLLFMAIGSPSVQICNCADKHYWLTKCGQYSEHK